MLYPRRMRITLLIALLAISILRNPVQPEKADLILSGGVIYTVNDRQPRAEAVAIKADRIVFVGSTADIAQYQDSTTRRLDLRGATVVPGLTDAHYHLSGVGMREMTLNLEGTSSLAEFLSRVKARVDQAKPGEWVTGRGWIETFWKPQVFRRDSISISSLPLIPSM